MSKVRNTIPMVRDIIPFGKYLRTEGMKIVPIGRSLVKKGNKPIPFGKGI